MTKLFDAINGYSEVDEALVTEYYERNERKKDDEKWLKENKAPIQRFMQEAGKDKTDIGSLRVTVSVPDSSHFDTEKVMEFLDKQGCIDLYTKQVLDEEKLMAGINDGRVDIEALRAYAWVESTGTPRLTITRVKRDNSD